MNTGHEHTPPQSEWPKLAQIGAEVEVNPNIWPIRIGRLSQRNATIFGYTLLKTLDAVPLEITGTTALYRNMPIADFHAQLIAHTRSESNHLELRPCARRFGLRFETERDIATGSLLYRITADIRNEFEDHPELDGARKLYDGFEAAVAAVDFEHPTQ